MNVGGGPATEADAELVDDDEDVDVDVDVNVNDGDDVAVDDDVDPVPVDVTVGSAAVGDDAEDRAGGTVLALKTADAESGCGVGARTEPLT